LALTAILFVSIEAEIGPEHGPFDIAMLPIWRGGTLSFIARLDFRMSPSSLQTNLQSPHAPAGRTAHSHSRLPPHHISRDAGAGPVHTRRAARSPLARDAFRDVFAGSDFEAFDPIVKLEQAKHEMGGLGEGEGEGVQIVGDWWMGGGMGVIDVGETAVVHVGETGLPRPGCFRRRVFTPQKQCERTRYGHNAERYEWDTHISPIHIECIQRAIYTCVTTGNGDTTRRSELIWPV